MWEEIYKHTKNPKNQKTPKSESTSTNKKIIMIIIKKTTNKQTKKTPTNKQKKPLNLSGLSLTVPYYMLSLVGKYMNPEKEEKM